MAVYGDVTFDSRVRREAATLARGGHEVRLVCLADEGDGRDLPEGVTVLVRRPTRSGVLPRSPNPFRVPGARRVRAVLDREWDYLQPLATVFVVCVAFVPLKS